MKNGDMVSLTAKVPRELLMRLTETAAANQRSIAGELRWVLLGYLNGNGEREQPKEETHAVA